MQDPSAMDLDMDSELHTVDDMDYLMLCEEVMDPNFKPVVNFDSYEDFDFMLYLVENFIESYIESHSADITMQTPISHTSPIRHWFYTFKEEFSDLLTKLYCTNNDGFHSRFWSSCLGEDLVQNWMLNPLFSFLPSRSKEPSLIANFLLQQCRNWIAMEKYNGFLYHILAQNFIVTSTFSSDGVYDIRRYYTLQEFEEYALTFCQLSLPRNSASAASSIPQELYNYIFLRCFNIKNCVNTLQDHKKPNHRLLNH